jgi:hypothetical protein
MATGLSTAAANTLLGSLTTTYRWVQLHTASPGAAGTTAVAVNSTRQQATFAAASGASIANSADVTWTGVAGSEDYTHFTVWTASTAGSFGFSGTITANPVSTGDGFTFQASAFTASFPTAS